MKLKGKIFHLYINVQNGKTKNLLFIIIKKTLYIVGQTTIVAKLHVFSTVIFHYYMLYHIYFP